MTDTSAAPLLPVLIPAHILDDSWAVKIIGKGCFTLVGLEAVTDAAIAADLRELSQLECAARGIRHSSSDHDYTALSDADTDEHCLQALRSAGRRCGL